MNNDFWNCVRHGCKTLGIPDSTYHVWKHRGHVSRDQTISIYQALLGTDYEVSLDQLNVKREETQQ